VATAAVPDLVEAAARAGRPEEAVQAAAVFERWAGATASPWALAMAACCRGVLAPPGEGGAHFDLARRLHETANQPFDAARTELLQGEELRRARRRAHARVHLRTALEAFEQLGAVPWAARAQAELRASGETARRRDPSTADTLTPQERQIAGFVAKGATNREVAAQLFLSPRTVDYHLHKVFTKLGITARAELIRLALHDSDGRELNAT
jgi:DNA-binding CsgD family transcriptional regulator